MLGKRLAELRKKRGLSQYELAEKLNFTRGQIANYEQGKREPDHETLSKIADFFGVSVDYLLGRTDDPTPIKYEFEDPEINLFFKDFLSAPEERRREMIEIWEIIKRREAGRKPGDKQGE